MPAIRNDVGSGWVKCQDDVTWVNLDHVSRLVRTVNATDDNDMNAFIVGAETNAEIAKQIPIWLTATDDEMDELIAALRGSMNLVDVPAMVDAGAEGGGAPTAGRGLNHGWVLCDDENTFLNLDNVTRLVRGEVGFDPDTFSLTAYILGGEVDSAPPRTVVVVTESEFLDDIVAALEDAMQLVKVVEVVDTEA